MSDPRETPREAFEAFMTAALEGEPVEPVEAAAPPKRDLGVGVRGDLPRSPITAAEIFGAFIDEQLNRLW